MVSATDGSFEDNRISKLNRQILSGIAEYQREEIVFNLSVSKERKKQRNKRTTMLLLDGKGKCEGRKTKKELENQKADEFAGNILTFVRVGLCE